MPTAEVGALFGLALGLRLYRIAEYTAFQGDQGIDALAAKRLLVEHVLPLEGPATSAGGVHLGPLYYYLLAAPMLVVWLDPLADAVSMAVLGALATGLIYLVARRWFGRLAAIVAAGLFCISPAAIEASRSAWNPAPAPCFALLALVGLEMFRHRLNGRWLVLVGGALGSLIQFHYFNLGLVLVVVAVEAWLVAQAASWRLAGWGVVGLCVGGALLAPFIDHEIAGGFPNVHAAEALLSDADSGAARGSLARRVYAVLALMLVGNFMTAGFEPLAVLLTLAFVVALGVGFTDKGTRFAAALLAGALGAALAQAIVYRGPIPQHYLLAYAPIAYLALANVVAHVPRWRPAAAVCAVVVVSLLVVNVAKAPFGVPDRQLARAETIAALIDAASSGERFGVWLLDDNDSDGAYRFELERMGDPPVRADEPRASQLFVVCQSRPCDLSAVLAAVGPDWAAGQAPWRAAVGDVQIVRLIAAPPA